MTIKNAIKIHCDIRIMSFFLFQCPKHSKQQKKQQKCNMCIGFLYAERVVLSEKSSTCVLGFCMLEEWYLTTKVQHVYRVFVCWKSGTWNELISWWAVAY